MLAMSAPLTPFSHHLQVVPFMNYLLIDTFVQGKHKGRHYDVCIVYRVVQPNSAFEALKIYQKYFCSVAMPLSQNFGIFYVC